MIPGLERAGLMISQHSGVRRSEGDVQSCVLPRQRLVSFVDLVREQDSVGLAMRPERHWFRCRALPPEPREDPGEPLLPWRAVAALTAKVL